MPAVSPRVRLIGLTLVTALVVALMPLATPQVAFAGPIADSDALYDLCGRTFPDPHAYWAPGQGEDTPHPGSGTSPFAKGNAPCAAKTFISYEEAVRGLNYLEQRPDTGQFIDVINLATTDDPRMREVLDDELGDGWSEGLPKPDGSIDKGPLYLVRVTAPEAEAPPAEEPPGEEPGGPGKGKGKGNGNGNGNGKGKGNAHDKDKDKGGDDDDGGAEGPLPIADRKHFAWSLSVHGIERAGIEGGLRAIEDLATWGANEPERRLLETYDSDTIDTVAGNTARNLTVGEVLENSVSYFILPNPDGWRRGDLDRAGASFARFNGNGMDLNRDWPEIGYVDPAFTPWSESESRSYGKVLQNLSDNWAGGIDLHGMVQAKAFSFTLIGGAQRPYDKNERTMQFVEQAWDDASKRLTWSSMIKPNSEVDQCLPGDGVGPNGEVNPPPCDQRMYGVQYGTIWDTIDYTATGAIGNWIDSPIGLDADGIDNEMSLSHLGNCGTGNCYIPEAEQLHVDGNKSLIYAMLNFSLQPPPSAFDVGGDVGYFVNPRRLVDPGEERPEAPAGVSAPEDVSGRSNHTGGTTVLHEFTVDNASGETYVGGIHGEVRWGGIDGHSPAAATNRVFVEHRPEGETDWQRRPAYNPGATYVIAGQRSDWNYPEDGDYRLVATGTLPTTVDWALNFTTGPAWEDPVQAPFNVSNMDFFTELEPHMAPGSTLTGLNVDNVLAGQRSLGDFDTIVIADDALLPGYREEGDPEPTAGQLDLPPTNYTAADRDAIAAALKSFVEAGGNLVLTDDGFRALSWMGIVPAEAVRRDEVYAGAVAFTADAKETNTYDDPLAAGVNQPGSAENTNHQRQVAEPLPTGYSINDDSHPQWNVEDGAWTEAGGRVVGTQGEGSASTDRVTLGELELGAGRIRILGSLLPYPTTEFFHPFGLSSYGITDPGFTLSKNMWTWSNPSQNPAPNLSDDPITWINSATPRRVGVAGCLSGC